LATANSATAAVQGLGDYERLRHTSEVERKRLDELVNTAAERLCHASSILTYLSEALIPRWETSVPSASLRNRPAETTREVTSALAKCALTFACHPGLTQPRRICHADAERLAIRRLMTRAVSDSTLTPGHPLPRSHPSPSLLAKLHLNVANLYVSAGGLLNSCSANVSDGLRRYIADQTALAHGMSHKWLGVDRGEHDAVGEATAWLALARDELRPLAKKTKALAVEVEGIESFLTAYQRLNDTVRTILRRPSFSYRRARAQVSFQPIPKITSLLAMVPGGRAALTPKPYRPPAPAFTGSKGGRPLDLDFGSLAVTSPGEDSDSDADEAPTRAATYAGKGGYF
jgi:hypothetical protein